MAPVAANAEAAVQAAAAVAFEPRMQAARDSLLGLPELEALVSCSWRQWNHGRNPYVAAGCLATGLNPGRRLASGGALGPWRRRG